MKKLYTLTLSWEELDKLLKAIKESRAAEARGAEEFERLAQKSHVPEQREAARDLAKMYRKDEGVYRALEDKLREVWP